MFLLKSSNNLCQFKVVFVAVDAERGVWVIPLRGFKLESVLALPLGLCVNHIQYSTCYQAKNLCEHHFHF